MGRARTTYGRGKKCAQGFGGEILGKRATSKKQA
jgi:hypothetical protein